MHRFFFTQLDQFPDDALLSDNQANNVPTVTITTVPIDFDRFDW